ncbi:MAG: metallophosphoesterase [Treponema sp.]|nr:metallophosphoesterase [Treponema sp.]
MLSFYGGTNFYIARRLFQWISLFSPHINIKVYAFFYLFAALSMVIGFLPIPSVIKSIISWIGSHWIGVFIYLLLLFFAADIALLLGKIIKIIPTPIPPNTRFIAGLVVVLTTAALVIYGKYNTNQIQYVSYDIQTKKPASTGALKIVLISDLHLGTGNNEKNLSGIVQGINNLKPDIVCITGDIFNDNYYAIRKPGEACNLFRSIESKYGIYACLGNHDGGRTFSEMAGFLEQSNITLLNDEYKIIDDRIVLIGRVDPRPIGGFNGLERKDIADILASINIDMPVVVMDHDPSNIKQYDNRIDLLLSGHTHKGQIFPGNLITNAMYTADYGHYQKDTGSPHIVVTSGVSTWGPPMRIGTNNEIAAIILR